jgi:hypothetical protein
MKKPRYIRVKDLSCNNADDIYNNYSGLWRYLKVDRVQRRDNRGYMLWTQKHVYKLEPSNVPTTSREEVQV